MKTSEFRKLIREEIRKVLKENAEFEAEFKVGQVVKNDAEDNLKIVKVYPDKQAALSDLKGEPDYPKIMKQLKDFMKDGNYLIFRKANDESPWYLVTLKGKPNLGRYLAPESNLFKS